MVYSNLLIFFAFIPIYNNLKYTDEEYRELCATVYVKMYNITRKPKIEDLYEFAHNEMLKLGFRTLQITSSFSPFGWTSLESNQWSDDYNGCKDTQSIINKLKSHEKST